jgi:hypothetical protein
VNDNGSLKVLRLENMEVQTVGEALAMRDDALAFSRLLATVENDDQNAVAVKAMESLAFLIRGCEKARKEIKLPVVDLGRDIDAKAKEFTEPLKVEELRVARIVADFQQLELAKRRAAEAARNLELDSLEHAKQEQLAKATSLEEHQTIREEYDQRAEVLPAVMAPTRAEGQVLREEWDIQVTDIWALARTHPSCVKIEPRLLEIKYILNSGGKVTGVTATRVVKAGVR